MIFEKKSESGWGRTIGWFRKHALGHAFEIIAFVTEGTHAKGGPAHPRGGIETWTDVKTAKAAARRLRSRPIT